MLFTVIKLGFKGQNFRSDPKNFVSGTVKGTALSILITPIITAVLFLASLFILGFTTTLGGPYFLAKVFFWIIAVGYSILLVPAYFFYKVVKGMSAEAGSAY